MDFSGLLRNFSTSRPLTVDDRRHRLRQKERLEIAPHYQLSVIRLNSTYLELVDKWYAERGLITALAFAAFAIVGGGFGLTGARLILNAIFKSAPYVDPEILIWNGTGMIAMVIPIGWALSVVLRKESFQYTHYPTRFNRRTRLVHVFRTNGSVLTVPWHKIFFTIAPVDHLNKFWNILGHVLEDDRETVSETFAFSISEMGSPEGMILMRSHWEFVRRYMEDGPASVAGQVQFCLPLDDKRETFLTGMHRLLANSSGACLYSPIVLASMALSILITPFRYFSSRSSRVPKWPDEVEASSAIENGDPYAIVGTARGDRIAVYPQAAEDAGVRFMGPPMNPL
jgi:hypothetical protein